MRGRREERARVRELRLVGMFAGLSRTELRRVDRLGAEISIRKGQTLTREGNAGRECFVVLDGFAEVSIDGRHLADVGPGGIIGEMALFTNRVRSATAKAASDVRVLVLQRAEFAELLAISPRVERALLTGAAERESAVTSVRLELASVGRA